MRHRRLTCRDVVELATEYFEGGLPAGQGERFATHLAGCRGCQTYVRQLRITVDIVHEAQEPEPLDPSAALCVFRRRRGTSDPDDKLRR